MILIVSSNSWFPKRHQYLSIWAELANDMPRFYTRLGCGCHSVVRVYQCGALGRTDSYER